MPENNECQPIVIYPLGVACQVTNPSGANLSNGSATLIITGGTPPYNITWANGNSTTSISNLSVGSYPATITDYYGDFTANTTCVLTGPVVPTTTTTTTTIPVVTYDFCMVINYNYREEDVNLSIHFNPNGVVNGKQSWLSDDELYSIVWDNVDNRWELVDTVDNLTVINNNPNYPPLTNWLILGRQGTVTVTEGECVNVENLRLTVTKNDPSCTSCDASLTLQGNGGVPPYQYSINGGDTWVNGSLFRNLCPDITFTPQIKDSEGTIVTSQSGNVIFASKSVIQYQISLNPTTTNRLSTNSYQYNYALVITPPLPNDGTTIKFNIAFARYFIRTPFINSANATITSQVTKNGNTLPSVNNTSEGDYNNSNPGCTSFRVYRTAYTFSYSNLTVTANDTYTFKVTTDYQLTCDNPPPTTTTTTSSGPLYELQYLESDPLSEDNVVENSLGPLKFDLEDYATTYRNCCQASISGNDYSLTNTSISGCVCCQVTGWEYFYNRS